MGKCRVFGGGGGNGVKRNFKGGCWQNSGSEVQWMITTVYYNAEKMQGFYFLILIFFGGGGTAEKLPTSGPACTNYIHCTS